MLQFSKRPSINGWLSLGSDVLGLIAWLLALLAVMAGTGCQDPVSDGPRPAALDAARSSARMDPEPAIQPVTGQAIYGNDDRRELHEVPSRERAWAESTVALVERNAVFHAGRTSHLLGLSLAQSQGLCPDQRFVSQLTAAFCSGFLVGPDLIATAGHCIPDSRACANTRFVFGYAQKGSGLSATSVSTADIYSCRRLISSANSSTSDFAVIQLNRAVSGRKPLSIRRSGAIADRSPLTLIGHPFGLPVKIASGGEAVVSPGPRLGRFLASVDAFAGNSGSPVIHSVSGQVEGILVSGEPDYISRGSCRVAAVCGSNCRGEVVTSVDQIRAWLPASSW
jgi:hypothetical protein